MVFDHGRGETGLILMRSINCFSYTHYCLRLIKTVHLLLINPAECSIILMQIICKESTISIYTNAHPRGWEGGREGGREGGKEGGREGGSA